MGANLVGGSAIRVGPAGWSYSDWNGVFYPKPRPRGFQELGYVSQFFDTAEINTSFYQPLRADWTRKWLVQVECNRDFRFTAKLWRGFTHEKNATSEDEATFKEGLVPLAEHSRLGALLLQFPWSFKNTQENRHYLRTLIRRFAEYPLTVELRHGSWDHPDVFAWLREQGAGICNIDQPRIGKSMKPGARSTSAVGYVRLHGRNASQWFTENARPGDRYNYLYSFAELERWVARIRRVAQSADVVYVITNNHPEARAAVNALELASLLSGKRVRVPSLLAEHYRELKEIGVEDTSGTQTPAAGSLFNGV